MARRAAEIDNVRPLDRATEVLVDLAAVIAVGSEAEVRHAMASVAAVARRGRLDPVWVEELILQSYLFVGFPRTLNAARAWRKAAGLPAPLPDQGARSETLDEWARAGERTCAIVYGRFYDRLRVNVRELHPALDAWMIIEGYGKVLSRPGLDLKRRELCIVATCAVTDQERQLHSHLYGALNAGASRDEVAGALRAAGRLMTPERAARAAQLWGRVSKH